MRWLPTNQLLRLSRPQLRHSPPPRKCWRSLQTSKASLQVGDYNVMVKLPDTWWANNIPVMFLGSLGSIQSQRATRGLQRFFHTQYNDWVKRSNYGGVPVILKDTLVVTGIQTLYGSSMNFLKEKQNPCHTKLCALRCLISRPQNLILETQNQIRRNITSFLKTT